MSEKGRENRKCILSCREKQRGVDQDHEMTQGKVNTRPPVPGEEGSEKRVHSGDERWKFCI